jgi:hypothetical protein
VRTNRQGVANQRAHHGACGSISDSHGASTLASIVKAATNDASFSE